MDKKTFDLRAHSPIAAIAVRQLARDTGASRIVINQIKELKELGFRVIVLCEKPNKKLIARVGAECVRFTRWPIRGKSRRFWFNFRVKKWVGKNKLNLLISHGDVETNDILFLHNCVHLAHERTYKTTKPSPSEVAPLHDHIMKKNAFKFIVTNSKIMTDDIVARYKTERSKIKISYPKYDSHKFNSPFARADREKTRERLGIKREQLLIGLITSGDFSVRNVSFFIKIAFELESNSPGLYKFIVVGKDSSVGYEKECSKLGIAKSFIWCSTESNVESLYGAVDLIVLPAHLETFCCVALEAMACGTPVLLSSWIGASEIIKKDISELVIEGYNLTLWHDRIRSISNPSTLSRLSREVEKAALPYSDGYGKSRFKELITTYYMD